MSSRETIVEVIKFMEDDRGKLYKIIIGSDSENDNTTMMADFVTAIVVYRVGNGGRYFWRRKKFKQFHNLRDRIIQEVILSLDMAKEILVLLKEFQTPRFDFEIHVDIGENGETKTMLHEITGMVRAYNFEVKTKPASYGATKVADRHI